MRLNTYADPLEVPLSSSLFAPITIVSPSIDTLQPKKSNAAPSPAVSLGSTCVQPEVRSPGVMRLNTYTDPLLDPLSSSNRAPITTVSPSIATL